MRKLILICYEQGQSLLCDHHHQWSHQADLNKERIASYFGLVQRPRNVRVAWSKTTFFQNYSEYLTLFKGGEDSFKNHEFISFT